jgi:hypothetical protein
MSNGPSLQLRIPTNPDDFEQYTDSFTNSGATDIKTGFGNLDSMLEEGLKSERLFCVAARTGTGKTNFAIALASNLIKSGKKVLYFSTEFGFRKIWDRYKVYADLREYPLSVCDAFAPNIQQIEEIIKKVMPDVWIFDHVHNLGEDKEMLSEFSKGCNFIMRQYGNQCVLLGQLNRFADQIENGKRVEPRLSQIKGSDTIGQVSSRVLLMSEIKVSPEGSELECILDKNDSGTKGRFVLGLLNNPWRIVQL